MSSAAAGTAPAGPVDVTSSEHFTSLMEADLTRVSVLNFWAPWAEPCKLMNDVVSALATKHKSVLFLNVEAEAQSEVADSFDIESVPTFVLLRGHTLLGKISGANPAALSSAIETHVGGGAAGPSRSGAQAGGANGPLSSTSAHPQAAPVAGAAGEDEEEEEEGEPETPEQIEERCKKLMNKEPIMLFMKGNPDTPRCGFSQKTVNLLRQQGVEFGYYDILKDENVRQGLKKLNNWPTFPQIIIKGELIGGLDILKEHIENGEFADMVKAAQ